MKLLVLISVEFAVAALVLESLFSKEFTWQSASSVSITPAIITSMKRSALTNTLRFPLALAENISNQFPFPEW